MNRRFDVCQSRIAITGGTGFVGSAIARRLLIEGVREVIILSRHARFPLSLEPWRSSGRIKTVACDIRNEAGVGEALAGCDAVFHQAALRVTQCAREPEHANEIMVAGTANVVAACVALNVKKIVAASSAIVYGEATELPIPETHPLSESSVYGIAKIRNEQLLKSCREMHGLNYTVLRYFNVYGPGMTLVGEDIEVLIRWLNRLYAGLPPLIFGDGRQTLDWIFIDDVAEANWRALMTPESGETFNVCTGRETSMLELLETLYEVVGRRIPPEFHPVRSVNHVERRFGNPQKAEERLSFRARFRLEDGLRRLADWRRYTTTNLAAGHSANGS